MLKFASTGVWVGGWLWGCEESWDSTGALDRKWQTDGYDVLALQVLMNLLRFEKLGKYIPSYMLNWDHISLSTKSDYHLLGVTFIGLKEKDLIKADLVICKYEHSVYIKLAFPLYI